MERNIQTQAIVVKTSKVGEIHKLLMLLSPDLGLVNVMVYGGRKGKKTALAPLFSIGTFQLYHNPVREEYSLEEAVSCFIPDAIMQNLESTYTASLLCEIVSKTLTDEPKPVFDILKSALIALENNPEKSKLITICFIWKMLQIWGYAPDLEYCPICERHYEENEILLFSNNLSSPCCKNCADTDYLTLLPGSRRYLKYTLPMDFQMTTEVQLNPAAEDRIFSYLTKWIKIHVNAPLKTLDNWPF